MQCTSPMFLKSQGFFVPCGHCLGCRLAKSREWTIRLLGELSYWPTACFLTLTYDELHCPLSLKKRDLQLFWKRLRKDIFPRRLKYFSCGEYGETYGRPHYHAIVFGVDWNDEDVINSAWNKGYIKIGGVTEKSCNYVTSYVLKKVTKKEEKENYEHYGMQSPFQLVSQGLGLRYALDNADQLQDELTVRLQGRNVGMPRYYVRKLELDTDIMREISKKNQSDKLSLWCRRYGMSQIYNDLEWYNASLRSNYDNRAKEITVLQREQKEIHLRSRDRFVKGKF